MQERGTFGARRMARRVLAASKVLGAILIAAAAPRTASAQPAYRVKDIIAGVTSSVPKSFTDVNGTIFFRATDGVNGKELWKSDGTAAGTVMVADICPGACNSMPDDPFLQTFMLNVGGTLFFAANNNVNGTELWKSDGTPAGTVMVKDIRPGATGSLGTTGAYLSRTFVDVNGVLFFFADDGTSGTELWKSDGTAAGTVLVKDIAPGATSSIPGAFNELFSYNGIVLFAASDLTATGFELWKSDGTAAGTTLVKDISTSGGSHDSYPHSFVDIGGGIALFVAATSSGGQELYRTDGTDAGTTLVKDIFPGSTGGAIGGRMVSMNGVAYLTAADQLSGVACQGAYDAELWRSDGTPAGTFRVLDITPGNCDSDPQDLHVAGNQLFFYADDGVHGFEHWVSDGTGPGTLLLVDANPGAANGVAFPTGTSLVNVGSTAYFRATDGVHGEELWMSDGTPAGTFMLDDIYPGPSASRPFWMASTATHLFFAATDAPTGNEMWAVPLVPTLLAAEVSINEGSTGPNPVPVPVVLYPPSASPVTVNYATADGTANASDYTATAGSLTFAPGSSVQTFPVTLNGDVTPEANETFLVNLSGAAGAPVAVSQGVTTILNDDGPGISVSDVPGQIETGSALFFVTLSASSTDTITVNYATANGTAQGPGDYTPTSGTLTFLPGQTFKSVSVTITSDTLDEPNEDFFVNLTNPVFAFIADGQGVCTIVDDDAPPGLSVNNVSITEPATSQNMTFTVNLSPASGQIVTVDYATSDGTASSGSDYGAVSGTLTIAPGSLTASIPVIIIGDNVDEPNETFNLNLTNPTNAGITDGLGVGTINDNDTTNITINNVTVPEQSGPANFVVTLSAPFFQDITINYATADGTATAGPDYTSASGTLTITSGTTTMAIPVPIIDDNLDEPVGAETFFVNLTGNSGGNLTDGQGQGSITDNDTSQIQITSVSAAEGNSGMTPSVFDLTLSGPSVNQVTVNYVTAPGTPNPATANVDYLTASGTLTFLAGSTTTTPVTVNVLGDTTAELDETFFVNLAGVTGGAILPNPAHGVGTIVNDDTPGFGINNVTVTEGNAGSVNATFTVTLQGVFSGTPTVDFATADGTATAPGDYTTTSGTLTFGPGVTTRTLLVPVVGENLDEPNEDFLVNLTNPTGGVLINDGQGVGTITDNDTTSITIANLTVAENVASGLANFVVTFSVPNSQDVTLDYATADGTAVAPGDYTAVAGTLTFPAGTASMAIPVPIIDDTLDEPVTAETLFVNLSNSSGPTITDAQAQGSITDNDASSLAIGDINVTEGDAGSVDAVFTVSLGGGKNVDVTVNFATAAGTPNPATPDVDYTTSSGTLSFPACSSSPCPAASLTQTVTVPVLGDLIPEADENFVVNLSAAVGAAISDAQGKCTIVDNEGLPSLSINDVSILEPPTGTANAVFTVTLAPTSPLAVTVTYATANGTATAPADYTAATGSLSFTAGQSTKSVTVPVKSDATSEAPETFFVNLTNPVNADFSDDQGLGTIVDAAFSPTELVHGSAVQADLAALDPTTPDEDLYRIQQPAHTSWEVVVDALSGDVPPVSLERISSTGAVLPPAATPIGDASVSLRWENISASPVPSERIRVRTGIGGCGSNCDSQDVYRIGARETTYHVARYNNSASQSTILVLQNPTDAIVDVHIWFWNGANGTLNGSTAVTISAKGVFSLNTSTVPGVAGTSGGLSVTHNAPYGALIGKAVAVETATGFTFDTPLEARAR